MINIKSIKTIAKVLVDLNRNIVYVGGAVVSMYVDDPAADDVRPTKDIDIVMEIASLKELEEIRGMLVEKGFKQTHEEKVVCRFQYFDIKIDVMANKSIDWAPGDKWFEAGFHQAIDKEIEGKTIKLLPFIYYLSSKFSAYNERGIKDPIVSKDFEDITYLLNHNLSFKNQILDSEDQEAKMYLKSCFQEILTSTELQEVILGNLYYEDQEIRFNRIIDELREIVSVIN